MIIKKVKNKKTMEEKNKGLRLTDIIHYDDVETGTLELCDGEGHQKRYDALWLSDLRMPSMRRLPKGIMLPLRTVATSFSYETPQVYVSTSCKLRIEPLMSTSWQDFGAQLYVVVTMNEFRQLAAMIQYLNIRQIETDGRVAADHTGETYFKTDDHGEFWK